MTQRIQRIRQLVAQIVRSCRRKMAVRSLSAFALASMWPVQVQAQLSDGLYVPDSSGVVGSATVAYEPRSAEEAAVDVGLNDTQGVFVGPGGVTSSTNMNSVLGPAINQPMSNQYVQQPYASGPFVQQQPVIGQTSYDIPCPCDAGCDVSYYGTAEALYFRRENDERFSLSRASRMSPFDYEWGGRLTVGRLIDCVNGYEFAYAGPFKWTRDSVRNGAGQDSRLTTVGLLPVAISTFDGADFHSQTYQARLNSYEVNRRWWAWDVFSVLVGLRTVDYRESYGFNSIRNNVGSGLYLDSTKNLMVGPQVGGDLMTPVGLRTLIGIKGKAALLGNFARNEILLQNAGTSILDSVDSSIKVAGLFEFGGYAKYSLTPSIRLHGGYEFWYVPGVATVPGQSLHVVSPQTGERVRAKEELLLHGASFGAQILF